MASEQSSGAARQWSATGWLFAWTLAWLVSLAVARFGPELVWGENAIAGWIAVGANLAVGVGWIIAFRRYLRSIDELQRKIQQDALGITLGIGWIVGFASFVAADAGLLPGGGLDVAVFTAGLGLVYLLAVGIGMVRYR
ncbi:hypothetical protein [Agromyces mangrovi Wang et al. 2018]|uniref:hypothetical protein n=1 Tax=Agromyces mangrovi TaxID=1858653 RepID=UPI002573E0CA|nr:hypothetical protein [Agromyces mangrovi]BDZ66345.1 hypothetical protein GCM10025877_32830 [Agromyces mangrovi]